MTEGGENKGNDELMMSSVTVQPFQLRHGMLDHSRRKASGFLWDESCDLTHRSCEASVMFISSEWKGLHAGVHRNASMHGAHPSQKNQGTAFAVL